MEEWQIPFQSMSYRVMPLITDEGSYPSTKLNIYLQNEILLLKTLDQFYSSGYFTDSLEQFLGRTCFALINYGLWLVTIV